MRNLLTLIVVLLLTASTTALAAEWEVAPEKDAMLRGTAHSGLNHGVNVLSFCGIASGSEWVCGIQQWALPSDINSVLVELATVTYDVYPYAGAVNDIGEVTALTQSWLEGTGWGLDDATAQGCSDLTYDGTNNWGTTFGDVDGIVYDTATITDMNGTITFDITALVQKWAAGTLANNGIKIKRAAVSGEGYFGVWNREEATSDGAILYIDYDPNTEYEPNATPYSTYSAEPAADNYCRATEPNNNYGTNPAMLIGYANQYSSHGNLVKWDMPADFNNARVADANMVFTIGNHTTTSGADYVLLRLGQSWTEAGSTMNTYDGTNKWVDRPLGSGSCGGYSTYGPYDIVYVPYTGTSTVVFDATELCQEWADGKDNYGIKIGQLGKNSPDGYLQLYSSEETIGSRRPKLNMTYYTSDYLEEPYTVYVNSITATEVTTGCGANEWAAKFDVEVVDQNGVAYQGAIVTVDWSGEQSDSNQTDTTDANGIATFTTACVPDSNYGLTTLTIEDINGVDPNDVSYTYHKYANLVNEMGICGGQLDRDATYIHYGHDTPTADYLRKHLAEAEAAAFDGVGILPTLNNGIEASGMFFASGMVLDINDFSVMREDLNEVPFNKMQHNFLLLRMQYLWGARPDYNDVANWAKVEDNLEIAAQIVKDAGLRGILLDTEHYNSATFGFPMDGYPPEKYNDINDIVSSCISAMVTIAPGIDFLFVYGTYEEHLNRLDFTSDYLGYDAINSSGYQCLQTPFLEGVLHGLDANSRVHTGIEYNGYRARSAPEYNYVSDLYDRAEDKLSNVSQALLNKIELAIPIFLDGPKWGVFTDSNNYMDNYYTDDEWQYALYHAAQNSDTYVWLYNEGTHFFNSGGPPGIAIPDDYLNALQNAGSPGSVTYSPLVTLFEDDFESGNLDKWTNSGATIDTTNECAGDYCVMLNGTDVITMLYDANNYESITVSYTVRLSSLEPNDYFHAEYTSRDGVWLHVEKLTDGDDDDQCYTQSFALGVIVDSNPEFGIHFRMEGGADDYAYIDDVTVTAVPKWLCAYSPSPADGATGVNIDSNLSWTAGKRANTHDVYFGTDSTPDAGEDQGNQPGVTYDPNLGYSTTYYWRIDELDGANDVTGGHVWSFTTETAASTSTYNFVNVTQATNDHYAYAYDVDSFPFGGNQNNRNDTGSEEATDAQYGYIDANDTDEWESADPGGGDEIFLWLNMKIDEDPNDITRIDLTFNGNTDTATTEHRMYVKDANEAWEDNSAWDFLTPGESIPADTDTSFTRSITSSITDYIDDNRYITWGVYTYQNNNDAMRINYVEMVVTYTP